MHVCMHACIIAGFLLRDHEPQSLPTYLSSSGPVAHKAEVNLLHLVLSAATPKAGITYHAQPVAESLRITVDTSGTFI